MKIAEATIAATEEEEEEEEEEEAQHIGHGNRCLDLKFTT